MDIFKISIEGDLASISIPFFPGFSEKMRMLGGKFNNDDKTWTVDRRNIENVREVMRDFFGRDDYPTDLTSVKVTFNKDAYSTGKAHFTLLGRLLASAKEGCKPLVGNDVSFYNGQLCNYFSGGPWVRY